MTLQSKTRSDDITWNMSLNMFCRYGSPFGKVDQIYMDCSAEKIMKTHHHSDQIVPCTHQTSSPTQQTRSPSPRCGPSIPMAQKSAPHGSPFKMLKRQGLRSMSSMSKIGYFAATYLRIEDLGPATTSFSSSIRSCKKLGTTLHFLFQMGATQYLTVAVKQSFFVRASGRLTFCAFT